MIYATDATGYIHDANTYFLNKMQCSLQTVLGKNIFDFLTADSELMILNLKKKPYVRGK